MSLTVACANGRAVIAVRGTLDRGAAVELLAVLEQSASGCSEWIVDVTHAREVTPVALALLKESHLWPRLHVRGLSYDRQRLLAHLGH